MCNKICDIKIITLSIKMLHICLLKHNFIGYICGMSIEDYNAKIMQGGIVKVERNETIRGSINHQLIASLREYWAEHGFPTEEDYVKHTKHIKLHAKGDN